MSVSASEARLDRADLFGGAIRCWQPRRGYRFSVDAFLLAMAAFDPPPDARQDESVLELGTGVGVVALALALNRRFRRIVGLELQPDLVALARRNVAESGLAGRVDIVEGDLRTPPPALLSESFDLVVSNPPYYPVGDGLLNPDGQRAIARHEIACRLSDVLARARASVRPDGRVVLVYPATRAPAILAAAPAADLTVAEVRSVRSRPGYPPRQVLLTLRPRRAGEANSSPRNVPTLDLHDETGTYAGPLAAFFRRLERLASRRSRPE